MAAATTSTYSMESQEIRQEQYFFISAAFFTECLLRGMYPEEAIKLAHSNPTFKTPFTDMVQNQLFAVQLTHAQQMFFIIQCLRDLMNLNLTAREREEYLQRMEKDFHHDEFSKQFNQAYETYNNNIDELAKRQRDELIQLMDTMKNKLISQYDILIQKIDDRIALIQEHKAVLTQKIAAVVASGNATYLGIIARIVKPVTIPISEKYQKELRKYGYDDTSFTFTEAEQIDAVKRFMQQDKLTDIKFSDPRVTQMLIDEKIKATLSAAPKSLQADLAKDSLRDLKAHTDKYDAAVVKDKGFEEYENYKKEYAKFQSEKNLYGAEERKLIDQKNHLIAERDFEIKSFDTSMQKSLSKSEMVAMFKAKKEDLHRRMKETDKDAAKLGSTLADDPAIKSAARLTRSAATVPPSPVAPVPHDTAAISQRLGSAPTENLKNPNLLMPKARQLMT